MGKRLLIYSNKTVMVRTKLFQVLFFIPCCIIDSVSLLTIHLPIWVFTGVSPNTKEGYIEWLLELQDHINKQS